MVSKLPERLTNLLNTTADYVHAENDILNDPNFPMFSDGRTMHLTIKPSDVAPRILSVGDSGRAFRISRLLDDPENVKVTKSSRGFTVYTGSFRDVPISIIATGMGITMMDFVVRECRQVIDGQMIIVRYGTCGGIEKDNKAGTVVVATKGAAGSVHKYNCDGTSKENARFASQEAFKVTELVMPDEKLCASVLKNLNATLGREIVAEGIGITGDSFYSSQGRTTPNFEDFNEDLIEHIKDKYPEAACLEMETFTLFYLSMISKGSIKAGAATISVFNRYTDECMTETMLKDHEIMGGYAILKSLAAYEM